MFFKISRNRPQGSEHHWSYHGFPLPRSFATTFASWYSVIFQLTPSVLFYCLLVLPRPQAIRSFSQPTTVNCGLLCARCLSVWILKSHRIFTPSFWITCPPSLVLTSHHHHRRRRRRRRLHRRRHHHHRHQRSPILIQINISMRVKFSGHDVHDVSRDRTSFTPCLMYYV